MITILGKHDMRDIEYELRRAINHVAKNFDLDVRIPTPLFTPTTDALPHAVTMRDIEFVIRTDIDSLVDQLKTSLANQTSTSTSREIMAGDRFKFNGTIYTIVRSRPKARTRKWIAKGPQDGRWIFTDQQVRAGLIR